MKLIKQPKLKKTKIKLNDHSSFYVTWIYFKKNLSPDIDVVKHPLWTKKSFKINK